MRKIRDVLRLKYGLLPTDPLGHQACRLGISTRYFRVSRLLDQLALARADGSYPRLVQRLA